VVAVAVTENEAGHNFTAIAAGGGTAKTKEFYRHRCSVLLAKDNIAYQKIVLYNIIILKITYGILQ